MSELGFLKLIRAEKTLALMGDPNAFTLASVIAYRAQRTDTLNIHDLAVGEALLGDHERYGMTQSQYRTAKKKLAKWGIASFRATNRGTIATLLDDTVYDINREQNDKQPDRQMTSKRRADDERIATTKNSRSEERKNASSLSERAVELAALLEETIRRNKPDFRSPTDPSAWAAVIDRMIAGGRDAGRIETLIRFSGKDPFWQTRIMSVGSLARNYDSLDSAEQRHGLPKKEPKKCFKGCGRTGVDYEFNDTGHEYWWCDQCYPFKIPGKGRLAKAKAKAQQDSSGE